MRLSYAAIIYGEINGKNFLILLGLA